MGGVPGGADGTGLAHLAACVRGLGMRGLALAPLAPGGGAGAAGRGGLGLETTGRDERDEQPACRLSASDASIENNEKAVT